MSASASFASPRTCIPAVAMLILACALEAGAEQPVSVARAPGLAPDSGRAANLPGSALEQYRRRYDEALAGAQFVEAETVAKEALGYLIQAGRQGDAVMADGLARLAFAQRQRELYAPAVANYRAAIRLLEARENRLSPALVAPLAALGETYLASGRADLAVPVYEHALHVRHVNDGPYTLAQIGLLDAMATALADAGQADAALGAVDRMFSLLARGFSPESEEVLPALRRKAQLLNELGRHDEERTVYREFARIVENRRGEHDLSLLDVYSAMGHTYFHDLDEVYFRSEPTTETAGTFFRKAVELAHANPEATWQMQARTLIELADYYTLRDVQDQARVQYRRAWALLSADPERRDRRRRDLERAVILLGADLDPLANFGYRSSDEDADPAAYKEGYVIARFTVNDRGRATDVEITDAEPSGFAAMETRVRQAVRGLIYRPRYADGQPVATPGQEFRHDYRYLERDLESPAGP